MSIDKLQDKIRKYKNPSMVEFAADFSVIPSVLMEEKGGIVPAYDYYCGELLDSLRELIPAVRFSFSGFALLGSEGLSLLRTLTEQAKKLGYYVLLDGPVCYSPEEAERFSAVLMDENCPWHLDGVVLCAYAGEDVLKPFVSRIKQTGKDVFVMLRTGNKTAAQLQDLLSGTRLVHIAAADIVNRMGSTCVGKRNYSAMACISSAAAPDSLRTLRSKYRNLFILVEGYDYPGANAKNCSFAFDGMGHGAIVCAGKSIVGAWLTAGSDGADYVQQAVDAAQRMKKNITRYFTVL